MDNIMNNTTSLQDVLTLLEDKAAGAVLPTLDNPAGADQVFAGYEVIDGAGAVVEGTFTIDDELSAQGTLIAQIQTALEGKAAGGGGDSQIISLLDNTITEFNSGEITSLRNYAFAECTSLQKVFCPQVTVINTYAFSNCNGLLDAVFPKCSSIGVRAFSGCTSVKKIELGGIIANIWNNTFANTSSLEALILRGTTAMNLATTGAFSGSSVATGTGYVYVPASLLETYKTKNNWVT